MLSDFSLFEFEHLQTLLLLLLFFSISFYLHFYDIGIIRAMNSNEKTSSLRKFVFILLIFN